MYDLVLTEDGKDFASVDGFETAILVSIFTDARASASEVPDPFKRRGWLGNLLTFEEGIELGSKLWLLDQSRITATEINQARAFTVEALRRFTADRLITGLEVDVSQLSARAIRIRITFFNEDNEIERVSVLWRRTSRSSFRPLT